MKRSFLLAAGLVFGLSGVTALGQSSAAPARPAEDNFPFPKGASQKATLPGSDADVPESSDAPRTSPQPASQAPSAQQTRSAPGGKRLPEMPTGGKEPDPPASSSMPPSPQETGTSSSRDAAGEDDTAPTSADGDTPVTAAPLRDLGSSGSSSEARKKLEATRVMDDLRVGSFYLKDGNVAGAYLRFKDAVEHEGDNEDALWGYAQTADKLNKRDEAREQYVAYLHAAPDGEHVKATEKALVRLGPARPADKASGAAEKTGVR